MSTSRSICNVTCFRNLSLRALACDDALWCNTSEILAEGNAPVGSRLILLPTWDAESSGCNSLSISRSLPLPFEPEVAGSGIGDFDRSPRLGDRGSAPPDHCT